MRVCVCVCVCVCEGVCVCMCYISGQNPVWVSDSVCANGNFTSCCSKFGLLSNFQ